MDQNAFRELVGDGSKLPNQSPTAQAALKAAEGNRNRTGLLPRAIAKRGERQHAFAQDPFKKASQPSAEKSSSKKSGRTAVRHDEDATPEAVQKLKAALEAKEITYRDYVDQVARLNPSGSLEAAGRARGLDRSLLARVRAGEDVLATPAPESQDPVPTEAPETERAVVDDEAALEAAFDETLTRQVEPKSSMPAANSREALLAKLRAKQGALEPTPDPLEKPSKFVPIAAKPTVEVIEKDGQKIKTIRDASGKVIKRLVKKQKHKPTASAPSPVVRKSAAADELAPPLEPAPASDDEDIFANAGDYDPFANDTAILEQPRTGKLFDNEPEDDTVARPNNAQDLLKENEEMLMQASAALKAKGQTALADTIPEDKRIRAGFGLVLDADAYDGLARETLTLEQEAEEEEAAAAEGGRSKKKRRRR